MEQSRCKHGHDSPDHGSEDGTCCDGRGGIPLETVNVVVCCAVENDDGPDAVEIASEHGDDPRGMVFDRPREPEEPEGDEHAADIRKREAVFGYAFPIISSCEFVVHCIDSGYQEPDGGEETKAWTEVHQADLFGVEAVFALVDGLEVCVQGIGGCEEDGLVDAHCHNDWLN